VKQTFQPPFVCESSAAARRIRAFFVFIVAAEFLSLPKILWNQRAKRDQQQFGPASLSRFGRREVVRREIASGVKVMSVIVGLILLVADIGMFAGMVWYWGWVMTTTTLLLVSLGLATWLTGFRAFQVGHA